MPRRPLVFLAGFLALSGVALFALDRDALALVWTVLGAGLFLAERHAASPSTLLWRVAAGWALVWFVARVVRFARGGGDFATLAAELVVSVLALSGILRARAIFVDSA